MKPIFLLSAIALAVGACDWDSWGKRGEIGRGVFYYECTDSMYDAACLGEPYEPDFPDAIAVGALFDMKFVRDANEGAGTLRVVEGSPIHIVREDGAMSIQKAGYAALLAMVGVKPVDIIHVFGQNLSDITLVVSVEGLFGPSYESIDKITLEPGEILQLQGIPKNDEGRSLAGLLQYDWNVADSTIAKLGDDATQSVVQIEAIDSGTTHLTVGIGDIVQQFEIEVTGSNTDKDGGLDTDADSGSDTETETDTDIDSGIDVDSGPDQDAEVNNLNIIDITS